MKESEMKNIAQWIHVVLKNKDDMNTIEKVKGEIKDLCDQFPIY
jgi:glycine hydroxymethyltransferase